MQFAKYVACGISLLAMACQAPAEDHSPGGEELYQLCSNCHGETGAGRPVLNAPAIAGLGSWYIEAQLKKFRSGERGTHPEDLPGMGMRPMAMSLQNDAQIADIAAHVAAMPATRPKPILDGDAAKGAGIYATCSTCHGKSGEGEQEKSAPALNKTHDWYLVRQLQNFKSRVRGGNPADATGAQMLPWVAMLDDEQAMKDVVAHIQTLK